MADGLEHFENVKLVPTEWADGDSFLARFPDGEERTLRLYGADCIEWHIGDETDARRLRAQRRYFGITGVGGSPSASIELATGLGEKAASATRELLAKPFAVHTAFADARGDGRYKRYYAFVTTSAGKDLAQELVARGLARAFGVYRAAPGGTVSGNTPIGHLSRANAANNAPKRENSQSPWALRRPILPSTPTPPPATS